jgi:flagellar motor switch protein FliN
MDAQRNPDGLCGMGGKPISRREAMRLGFFGAAGLVLAGRRSSSARAAPLTPPAKAKAVIQIWMWGGPPHLDTFDPKPDAGNDYCGPLNHPIPTNVDGIQIGELLPLLAKQADKYSIIRSMTHGVNAHETASYIVQTGRTPGGRDVYPSVGAVVSLFKGTNAGYRGLIPPYIVLTESQGRFSEAGFLGSRYKPFATGGDPAKTPFVVEGVVAQGISDQRQRDRRELLHKLNTLEHALAGDPQVVTASLGEARLVAREFLRLGPGAVVALSRQAGEPVDLVVNGVRFATGDLVVVGEQLGIRIREILSPAEAGGPVPPA